MNRHGVRSLFIGGSYPVAFDVDPDKNHTEVSKAVTNELLRQGTVREGEMVIITKGDMMRTMGHTNTMKILRVGET